MVVLDTSFSFTVVLAFCLHVFLFWLKFTYCFCRVNKLPYSHKLMDLSIQQTCITCCICAQDCSRCYRETKTLQELVVLVVVENVEVEGIAEREQQSAEGSRRGIEPWEVTVYKDRGREWNPSKEAWSGPARDLVAWKKLSWKPRKVWDSESSLT